MWYQHQQRLTVPANSTATYTLPATRNVLEKLTIWGVTSRRSVTNLSAQVKINGNNLGSATAISGRAAFDVLLNSATTNLLWPIGKPDKTGGDDFTLTVVITSTHGAAQDFTIYSVAVDQPRG